MEINELIKIVNNLFESTEKIFTDYIYKIINDAVNISVMSKYYNRNIINQEEDLKTKGFEGRGFYMIFNDNNNPKNKCKCETVFNNKKYYCVYRGEAFNMKKRVTSHLFYNPNGDYKSCMKITIDGKKYNINIANQHMYFKGVQDSTVSYTTYSWLVVRISLPKSNQGLREIFEKVFDETYNRPIYSCK